MPSISTASPAEATSADATPHDATAGSRLVGYAIALIASGVAVLLALAAQEVLGGYAASILLVGVAAAAGFGGLGPGLCATAVAGVALLLWFDGAAPGVDPLVGPLVVGACGIVVSLLGAMPRRRPLATTGTASSTLDPAEPVPVVWPNLDDPAVAADADRIAHKVATALDERLEADRRRVADERHFHELLDAPDVAVWRFAHERPVDTSLPEDEQIEQLYQTSYLAECNDATARMYGFSTASEIIGTRLVVFLSSADPANLAYLRRFIRSGYRLEGAESHEVDRHGNRKHFVNELVGIVEGGYLLGAWGTQRDITEERRPDDRS